MSGGRRRFCIASVILAGEHQQLRVHVHLDRLQQWNSHEEGAGSGARMAGGTGVGYRGNGFTTAKVGGGEAYKGRLKGRGWAMSGRERSRVVCGGAVPTPARAVRSCQPIYACLSAGRAAAVPAVFDH